MVETVLVPIDGSPLSFRALHRALELFSDASVVVYYVSSPFDPGQPSRGESSYEPLIGSDKWYAMERDAAEELLAEAESIAEDSGRNVETAWEIGDPQRLIPEYALEEGVDHIVMGVHGREEPDRSLVGRVAETVVFRSPVSVTVIR